MSTEKQISDVRQAAEAVEVLMVQLKRCEIELKEDEWQERGGGVEAGGRSPEIKSVSEMLQKHAVNTFSSILSRETKAQRYATQTQIHIKKNRKTVKPNKHHFICCKTNNKFSE